MPLDTDGRYDDSWLGLLFDSVEDANIAQSQFPWRDRIGTQHFPFPGRHSRFMRELLLDPIQDQRLSSLRERREVVNRLR